MNDQQVRDLAESFLDAWNRHDIDAVVATYTKDLTYIDPNTRGPVEGADAMRHYLAKLFESWQMHWDLRQGLACKDDTSAAVLWHATFARRDGEGNETVEIDGMDLVVVEGELISRNEVYFDRAKLAPLITQEQ